MNTQFTLRMRKDGSVTIPAHLRALLDIEHKDSVALTVNPDNTIHLAFEDHTCPICLKHNSADVPVGGIFVCDACNSKILAKIRKGYSIDTAMCMLTKRGRK